MNRFITLLCALVFVIPGVSIGQSDSSSLNEYVPVSGRVTDENGTPLEDIQVHYMMRKATLSAHAGDHTDKDGSFTLQLLKESDGFIFANDPESTPSRIVDYKLLSKATDNINLVLKSTGKSLSGKVVDSQGIAVPNALLALGALSTLEDGSKRLGLIGAGPLYATADDKGYFSIENLPALPLIIYTARSGETTQLHSMYLSYPKDATVDLKSGNKNGLQLILDNPKASYN